MNRFTANYSGTNHNFVIQNLFGQRIENEYLPAICILKNILQRGCPTKSSVFLQEKFGVPNPNKGLALISVEPPKWERIIRGDTKSNYYPALKFFESLIPKYFSKYPFIQQLIVPEVPINEITQIQVDEFLGQQVDFYLPLAFLVIEIDGSQHDAAKDSKRDKHLEKYGICTVRISTKEVESENEIFFTKIGHIRDRIERVIDKHNHYKLKHQSFITFEDYNSVFNNTPDYGCSEYIQTSVIRFQILILELLEKGRISLQDEHWKLAVYNHEGIPFEESAIEDLFLWFENILKLMKLPFKRPIVTKDSVKFFEGLQDSDDALKIDFSISERYTDQFQNHSEILFVRSDYFDHFRHYKKSNSINPEYVGLEPYNYYIVSTCELVNYRIKFTGIEGDENALCFFLENIFGYKTFNQGQLPIIANALARNDTIGLLPTGAGKSLCYQLVAMLQPAISFVVCPIKSLMYDQIQDLENCFIRRVNQITSDNDSEDKEKIMNEFANGKYHFIFISPERFQIKSFRQYMLSVNQKFKIAYAIVDEVHCLSEWGHDFRTSYLNLTKTIRDHCDDFRFIGLTATASLNVLQDIQIEFGVKQENIRTLMDYTRKELEFEVVDVKTDKLDEIRNIISKLIEDKDVLKPREENSDCGIIFTRTKSKSMTDLGCFELAGVLTKEYRTPIKYYSGEVPSSKVEGRKTPIMDNGEFNEYKRKVQEEFKSNKFTLLVATKAFGMGVNKPNVFYTIHYGIPGSMESLYQEAGRAGRDKNRFDEKKKAQCYVLFSKTSDNEALQHIWDPNTNLSCIINNLKKIDGDVNTNLFLFTVSNDIIKDEYALIKKLIDTYVNPNGKEVKIKSSRIGSNKAKTEKAIYRLMQLGIIEDWTVENFFDGEFAVDFKNFSVDTIKEALCKVINTYDKAFNFESLSQNAAYGVYNDIWNKPYPIIDKCIVLLLQWAYDHFANNRRQSLKNIYENCDDYVSQKVTKEAFKKRLEDYFKFTEVSYLLQHIVENPTDFKKWFEAFYQVEDNNRTENFISWEQKQSLLANLSRFLESYQFNIGLNLVSGLLRLLIKDFDNTDGKPRFESAFEQILKFPKEDSEYIFQKILEIGNNMDPKSKSEIAETIISFYPSNSDVVWKIHNVLEDNFTISLLLEDLNINSRLSKINKAIHDELIYIG